MANTKAEVKRHPLAVAWDEWLTSEEGRSAAQWESLPKNGTANRYLENRLSRAFNAGASTAESNLAREVLNEIDAMPWNPAVDYVDTRLRELFTRLNVKID